MFDAQQFFPAQMRTAPRPAKRDYGRLLNLSNNELRQPQLDAIIATFYANLDISDVTRYPNWPRAVSTVAEMFGLRYEHVWISAGADQAIRVLMRIANMAGHRIVLQWPNYATYTAAAAYEGLTVERVPSAWCSAEAEVEALCFSARRPGRAIVVVTNPHAFTGRLINLEAVRMLAAVCQEQGHLLVIDEAYIWFAGVDHLPLLNQFSNLLLLRSFSKGLGMAGLRFAAMIAHPEVLDYIMRTRCMAEVSGLSTAFVGHCLKHWTQLAEIWRDIARRRDEAARSLKSLNASWSYPRSSANFQLVNTGSKLHANGVVLELEKCGILVRSLAADPALSTCFRYSVCGDCSTDRLLSVLDELARREES